jgi:outer membrane protein TolC
VAATASQQLYEFGRIAAQSTLADALTDVARANAVTVQLDIGLRVEEAYSAVLAAKHILTATQEAYRRAEALYRMAEAGVRTGLRPPIDRTRSQAELAQAEVARTRAETGLTSAQAALAAVIGSPELLIDAAERKPQDRAFPGLAEALRIAEEHSPEVMAALARLHAQQSETSVLTRELLPTTYVAATVWGSAGGGQGANAEVPVGNGWLASIGNFSASLVLSWHMFDPVLVARRSASQKRQQVEQAAVEVARRGVVLQVQRSYIDLVAAQKTLPGLVATVAAGRANLEQAQARFKAGLGTIIDVTDAETLLVNAELNLAVGQFNVDRTAAQLARSLGAAQTP